MEIQQHQAITTDESIDNAFRLIQERLEENRREGTQSTTEKDSISICRVPQNLARISGTATKPEMVSIGPYHRDKDRVLEFQRYKWQFLDSLLSRIEQRQSSLRLMTLAMRSLEPEARRQYSERIEMSSDDFIQMMLLDGCFIIELFQQVCVIDDSANANSLVFMKPWIIPILIRDLLKLENQLPLSVLLKLYSLLISSGNTSGPLEFQALKFFNLALTSDPLELQALKFFSRPMSMSIESFEEQSEHHDNENKKHLLDLFYSSYHLPKISSPHSIFTRRLLPRLRRSYGSPMYRPLSDQSIPSVTRLRHAGVKFRPQKGSDGNFLDINFHKGVLEIPPITINDFTSTILINCAALEQCYPRPNLTRFSEYIAFVSCLIKSSRDVTFLCDDGIISNFSYKDQEVANLFKKLGQHVVFNIRDSYLKNEFREVEAYYSSNWATLRRTYFSSPWSTISVVSAFALLALTAIQTITTILSYKVHHN